LSSCSQIVKFFKKSHIGHSHLSQTAIALNIQGGSLKPFIKTRWTSAYETTRSIVQMRQVLEYV